MSAARRPWAEEPQERDDAPEAPFLRVTKGDPSPEELAAVTAVLVAAVASSAQEEEPKEATRSDVLRRTERLRSRLMAVPGAWRARGR